MQEAEEEVRGPISQLAEEEATLIARSFEPARERYQLLKLVLSALVGCGLLIWVGFVGLIGVGALSAAFVAFIVFASVEKAWYIRRMLAQRKLIRKLTFRIEQDEHRSLRAEARRKVAQGDSVPAA